jgi:hypothetical protein
MVTAARRVNNYIFAGSIREYLNTGIAKRFVANLGLN